MSHLPTPPLPAWYGRLRGARVPDPLLRADLQAALRYIQVSHQRDTAQMRLLREVGFIEQKASA